MAVEVKFLKSTLIDGVEHFRGERKILDSDTAEILEKVGLARVIGEVDDETAQGDKEPEPEYFG